MANHGPSYGFSREIQVKNQQRFNLQEAQEMLRWVADCLNETLDPVPEACTSAEDIGSALEDGVALCRLAERLVGKFNYNKKPKMPFNKMENIATFLDAIKRYGVPEISCFQTVDLYERKQMYKVIECMRSLACMCLKNKASIPIPAFAIKIADSQPRNFPDEIMKQGQTMISLQYGTNKGASQKGMTPYGLGRQIKPDGK